MEHLFQMLDNIVNKNDSTTNNSVEQILKKIQKIPGGNIKLIYFLIAQKKNLKENLSHAYTSIFLTLYRSKNITIQKHLKDHFNQGIVPLESSKNINYYPLYKALVNQNFKQANLLTSKYLNKLVEIESSKRQWLYFTDVYKLPSKDLKTIDKLWNIYSYGKFGYSIQRKLWINNNKKWDKFWEVIGWEDNNKLIRYPNDFIWDASAPIGHLPLWNQLRGIQVISAFFNHDAWEES